MAAAGTSGNGQQVEPARGSPDASWRKGGTPNAARRIEIDERRAEVAALVLQHVPYREIARRVDVALGTIVDDVRIIRKRWQERSSEHYSMLVSTEVARLDAIEAEWLPIALDTADVARAEIATRVLDRTARHKARLLGIEAPRRIEASLLPPPMPEPERRLEELGSLAAALVREIRGVEQVERQAIEVSSRIRDDEP